MIAFCVAGNDKIRVVVPAFAGPTVTEQNALCKAHHG
jgi:hypothetical protein